jgi:hypothetical protein
MPADDYDVVVKFMDGEQVTYPKCQATREDGCLVLRVSHYYGSRPAVKYVLPLVNIRQVEYR